MENKNFNPRSRDALEAMGPARGGGPVQKWHEPNSRAGVVALVSCIIGAAAGTGLTWSSSRPLEGEQIIAVVQGQLRAELQKTQALQAELTSAKESQKVWAEKAAIAELKIQELQIREAKANSLSVSLDTEMKTLRGRLASAVETSRVLGVQIEETEDELAKIRQAEQELQSTKRKLDDEISNRREAERRLRESAAKLGELQEKCDQDQDRLKEMRSDLKDLCKIKTADSRKRNICSKY